MDSNAWRAMVIGWIAAVPLAIVLIFVANSPVWGIPLVLVVGFAATWLAHR